MFRLSRPTQWLVRPRSADQLVPSPACTLHCAEPPTPCVPRFHAFAGSPSTRSPHRGQPIRGAMPFLRNHPRGRQRSGGGELPECYQFLLSTLPPQKRQAEDLFAAISLGTTPASNFIRQAATMSPERVPNAA